MTNKKDNHHREAERVPISDLTPHPRNYREHPEDQIAHIQQSIKEHGFYRNVVVSKDNVILAGHGVVIAAGQLGMTEIPVVKLTYDSDSPKALKLLAADNYIQHRAIDDDRQLTELLKEISIEDDLLGTGFDDSALAAYLMVSRTVEEISNIDVAAEWANAGMPEMLQPSDIKEFADEVVLTVRFPTQQHRKEYVAKLETDPEFVVVTHSIKYPERSWTSRWPASESINPQEDRTSIKFIPND